MAGATLNIQQVAVGLAEVPLAASLLKSAGQVTIRPLNANVGEVYVGPAGVTEATGYELPPEGLNLDDVLNIHQLSAISTDAADRICIFQVVA